MQPNQNESNHNLNQNQNKLYMKEDFISCINSISDSIKNLWMLTSNINKKENNLINTLEKETISSPINIESIKNNISKLKIEMNLSRKNCSTFFENMKIIFKKMKDKQIELRDNQSKNAPAPIPKIKENNNQENQISDQSKIIKELQNENKKLKKDYELEIATIRETNQKLSLKLLNSQKEILNIQKENITKSQEIDNLKLSLKNTEGEERASLINSIKSILVEDDSIDYSKSRNNLSESVNKILNDYKDENDQLKLKQINFEEKIKEMENTNKNISSRLKILQHLYNDLMKEKRGLNEEVVAGKIKIIKLQFENDKYKNELDNINSIKLSTGIIDENKNESEIKVKLLQLNKKLKQEKKQSEELKEELTKIKNDNEKYKKKLLGLGVNYIVGQEVKINRDDAIEKLNDEIEQLKEKNKTLSEAFETLCNQQFWNNNSVNQIETK